MGPEPVSSWCPERLPMRHSGNFPQELEIGNAWDGRSTQRPETNWIVGQVASLPIGSLRFLNNSSSEQGRAGDLLTDLAVKWFVHGPADDPSWGRNKPTSSGRSLSIYIRKRSLA